MTIRPEWQAAAEAQIKFMRKYTQSRYRVKFVDALPRRVRLRLCVHRCIDTAAVWLIDHGHENAAVRLWKICGMW